MAIHTKVEAGLTDITANKQNIESLKNKSEKVSTVVEVLEDEEKVEISSDHWNPAHFGETPRKVDANGNPTVFWDESIEPPLPDDFESLQEYEEAWLSWEKDNSDSLMCATSEIILTPGLVKLSGSEYSTSTSLPKKGKKKSSDCWYTPPHIFELVVQVLGQIDLDPCADDGKHLEARKHYTIADNGLAQKWEGRVYMNPPFSCPGLWMNKLQSEFESGKVKEAIALVPAATDTNWLSPLLKTQPVCFWKGRIKFLDEDYQPKRSARQSHVLVYWGKNWERFREVFEPHGFVSVPSQFLEDKLSENISSRKTGKNEKFLEDKLENKVSTLETRESKFLEDKLGENISFRKNGDKKFLEDKPEEEISSRKTRRCKGAGSGCIYYRTVTKKCKEYREAYYQYEVWKDGDRLVKSSKYIPKRLLPQVQRLESEKAPVREILRMLGIYF